MSKDLRDFLKLVREAGAEFYTELKKPIDPMYEVSVIQEKLVKEGRYPVVYCPSIKGSKLPLVANLFSSYEMIGLALGLSVETIKKEGKAGIFREYSKRQEEFIPTKEIPASQAPVKEVILQGEDVDLGVLPITKHAVLDSAKYITMGMVILRHPDTGIYNVGIYRQEVKGKDRLGMSIGTNHNGHQIAQRYIELGKPMEVVVIIGHHPAVGIGAGTAGPLGMNELEVMGSLLGEPLEVTKGLTVDLPVPAFAEIVLEGVVDPTKVENDGPFGEIWGFMGAGRPGYVIQVKAITMRHDAIYQDLDPGHQEHPMSLMLRREYNLVKRVSSVFRNLKALHIGPDGRCGKGLLYLSIKKNAQGDARLAGMAALCAEPTIKIAIVVDDDVDVYDQSEVLWALATRVRGDLDISIIPRMPTYWSTPSAYDETGISRGAMDTKILIDATQPMVLPFPKRITLPLDIWDQIKLEDYLK